MVASWTGSCLSRLMISDPILLPSYRISESMREKSNHQDLLDRFWLKKAKEKELSASQGRSFPVRPTRAWEFRGRTATRTMFYMPYVTNLIAIGVVWNYILNPYKGPVNRLLRSLGIAEQSLPLWLSGNNSALPVAALIHTWVGLAFPVITLLAALQQVPRSLIEVADLEGAGLLQRLRYVILPSLKPAILFILTITIINSFKNYTVIMALTEGGPGTATQVASMQIYADAFKYFKLGIASAEGTLLALIIFIINSLIQRKTYEY